MAGHTTSYYAATCNEKTARGALQGIHETDVCVIGGGMAGLSTALRLGEYGKQVIVLEANRVGWGASGRNGGFVGAGLVQSGVTGTCAMAALLKHMPWNRVITGQQGLPVTPGA